MVHALERAHWLLQRNGRLIDIHPLGEPPPIAVRLGQEIHPVGWLRETDDYIEYIQASEAVDEAVNRGLFVRERQGTFAHVTYADTLTDLQCYLEMEWHDAFIEDVVAGRIEDLMNSIEIEQELILRDVVQITRLRPLPTTHTQKS
jgi:hypothetical protein